MLQIKDKDPLQVGARIKQIRNEVLGLSMTEFGKRIDDKVKSGTVSNWEMGKNLPNSSRLKRIAELGGVPLNQLLYGSFPEYAYNLLKEDILNDGEYYKHFTDRYSRRMMISIDEVDKKIAFDYLDSNKETIVNRIYNANRIMVANYNLNNKHSQEEELNNALYSDTQVISLAKKAVDEMTDYRKTYSEYIEALEDAIDSIGYFGTRYNIQQLVDRYVKKGLDAKEAESYALNDFYISKVTESISLAIDKTTEEYNESKNELDK